MAAHTRLAAVASTTSLAAAYTVPAGFQAAITKIFVCNREAAANTFRIAILDAGEVVGGVDVEDYWYYGPSLAANATLNHEFAIPLHLSAGMSIAVYGEDTNLTFQIWGSVGEVL